MTNIYDFEKEKVIRDLKNVLDDVKRLSKIIASPTHTMDDEQSLALAIFTSATIAARAEEMGIPEEEIRAMIDEAMEVEVDE